MLFWAIFLLIGILSFDANDPSLNHVVSPKTLLHNKAGLFGAYAAGFLNDVFGAGALLWPFVFAALGAAYISANYSFAWWRWCGFFLLTVCFLAAAAAIDLKIGDLAGGGMVGYALYANSSLYLSPVGSFLLWFFVFIAGLQLSFNFSWIALLEKAGARCREWANSSNAGEKGAGPASILKKWPRLARFWPPDAKAPSLARLPALLQGSGSRAKEAWARLIARYRKEESPPEPGAPHEPRAAGAQPAPFREEQGSFPQPFRLKEEGEEFGAPVAGDAGDAGMEEKSVAFPAREDASARAEPAAPFAAELGAPHARPEVAASGGEADDAPARPQDARSSSAQPASAQPPARPQACGNEKPAEIALPPLSLLKPPKQDENRDSEAYLESKSGKLISFLKDFGIDSDLVRITPGPVVTMFEIRPAAGIKGSRIVGLADDLSRALSAVSVRIQAPIPGRDTIGIEIPNDRRQIVNFREIADTDAFRQGCGPLTMILGKDIAGQPYLADLAHMPHLLVAGATGAGKSVCLNCILISLLYRRRPDEMQLLLVDPKRIEMALYSDSPHLVHPVVTEMSEAKSALDWAVHEMDRRYQAMARLGVRDVASFNQKMESFGANVPQIFADLEKIPYLVIVIDELADLMMTASREAETSIVRLAQLARAAGIHMILATQRPSVDVVTGLIKANFPCRISFQVTSKHDSRTILDQVGAEHLLGHGDMLFKPSGRAPVRLHGPFLSTEECAAVMRHWSGQLKPDYKIDFAKWASAQGGQGGGNVDATGDPLYEEARKFIIGHGLASTSLLQRQFKIGFNRAARIMAQFENEGIIGPADGSKPRQVLASPQD